MSAFKFVKTTQIVEGIKEHRYETDGGLHSAIIIENKMGFVIDDCSIGYYLNVVDTVAKTRQTLLRRLDKLFD